MTLLDESVAEIVGIVSGHDDIKKNAFLSKESLPLSASPPTTRSRRKQSLRSAGNYNPTAPKRARISSKFNVTGPLQSNAAGPSSSLNRPISPTPIQNDVAGPSRLADKNEGARATTTCSVTGPIQDNVAGPLNDVPVIAPSPALQNDAVEHITGDANDNTNGNDNPGNDNNNAGSENENDNNDPTDNANGNNAANENGDVAGEGAINVPNNVEEDQNANDDDVVGDGAFNVPINDEEVQNANNDDVAGDRAINVPNNNIENVNIAFLPRYRNLGA